MDQRQRDPARTFSSIFLSRRPFIRPLSRVVGSILLWRKRIGKLFRQTEPDEQCVGVAPHTVCGHASVAGVLAEGFGDFRIYEGLDDVRTSDLEGAVEGVG